MTKEHTIFLAHHKAQYPEAYATGILDPAKHWRLVQNSRAYALAHRSGDRLPRRFLGLRFPNPGSVPEIYGISKRGTVTGYPEP